MEPSAGLEPALEGLQDPCVSNYHHDGIDSFIIH